MSCLLDPRPLAPTLGGFLPAVLVVAASNPALNQKAFPAGSSVWKHIPLSTHGASMPLPVYHPERSPQEQQARRSSGPMLLPHFVANAVRAIKYSVNYSPICEWFEQLRLALESSEGWSAFQVCPAGPRKGEQGEEAGHLGETGCCADIWPRLALAGRWSG